jgi:hypothetical protein
MITPSNPTRAQYPVALDTYSPIGATITEQTRLKNLYEEISRVLSTENLGWVLELDGPNHQFLFKVLEGVDRTAGQSTNSRVLFGLSYGNISGYRKVKDALAARTVAIVGGQGEGSGRTIVEVDASGSGRRKETFVDARDVESETELTERGLQAIAELEAINAFEFQTLNRQFIYETDYDLGDFVTVVIDKADSQDLQIRKITEVYERGNITVTPEFGKPERSIGSAFSSMNQKFDAVSNAPFLNLKTSA